MNTCKECIHAEMCKWIDELEGRGCDFGEPCEDAISINSMVETIATKVTEDTEKFIFETIKPYCEEITKREISKKDLERALTQYFNKEYCDKPTHYGDSTEKCKNCEYKRNTCDDLEREYEKTKALFSKIVKDDDVISRDAVIEWLENATYEDISYAVGTELSFLPSVTQKSGKWLMTGEVDVYYDLPSYECSKCGNTSLEKGDYCPNCGAYMAEIKESEDEE